MKEQGIEEIFKSAFNNFEADVDPSVWTNVQHAIHAPAGAPGSHGANGSVAGKSGAVAAKLGAKAIMAIVTTVAGVSVGTYLLVSHSQSKKITPTTIQSQQPAVPMIEQQSAPITNEQTHSTTSRTSFAVKVSKSVAEKKVSKEKKQIAATPSVNLNIQPTPSNAIAPVKNAMPVNPIPAKESTASKPQPATKTPPPAAAKENAAKPSEDSTSDESHTFQNGFANINDYIDDEASERKGLPNAFSPNGDGHNDEFKIKTKNLKSIIVTVFDQTGKTIYHWEGLDGSWDGNLSDGHPAPVGLYYYSVMAETVDGKPCIGSSTLTLNR